MRLGLTSSLDPGVHRLLGESQKASFRIWAAGSDLQGPLWHSAMSCVNLEKSEVKEAEAIAAEFSVQSFLVGSTDGHPSRKPWGQVEIVLWDVMVRPQILLPARRCAEGPGQTLLRWYREGRDNAVLVVDTPPSARINHLCGAAGLAAKHGSEGDLLGSTRRY